ncbi:MAG: hypothetical protein RLZZ32_640, partial [Cyanobacteriota bacterium]
MAKERGADSNQVRSISNRLNNRLRRLLGLENLHEGGREQRDDVSESMPEAARPVQRETLPGEAKGAAGLSDAPIGEEWQHGFEAMPLPGGAVRGAGGSGGSDFGTLGLDNDGRSNAPAQAG